MNDATIAPTGEANLPASMPATGASPYRVLARKYRPSTFDEVIGQDAMVRTVKNAFQTGRIPQAWILTGVRGVGKTTTARILARALNYELPDGSVTGPTIEMPKLGIHCEAIMESRHLDVIEMDAASHNSVDDVRQINEAVRYAPVSARYKVYILDEVHMLSPQAFNALLKTLEEPPPHVKFIFATTDIRKVPVTVLSRCQRFDLRRVEAGLLVRHLERICASENVSAEPEALALIARAAEGSVRDALSLLDQAIAHGVREGDAVGLRPEEIRQMLGLADRARIVDLFEALMRGDIAKALNELRDQYEAGADPLIILTDLAEFTHFVTRVKTVPSVAENASLAEVERTRGRALAAGLSMRVLSRTWQMLFKSLEDVKMAARPLDAAEMALVRIAYAADLPSPDEVIRSLGNNDSSAPSQSAPVGGTPPGSRSGFSSSRFSSAAPMPTRAATAPAAEPIPRGGDSASPVAQAAPIALASFEDLVALADEKRDLMVKTALERDVRLVRFEDGRLEVALEPGAAKTLVGDLARKISAWTNRRWMVVVSSEAGSPTLRAKAEASRAELRRGVESDPLVQAVLSRFPGAEIVAVRPPKSPAGEEGDADGPAAAADDEELP
jgi:DNA polymerase-3 subunit gamma/tau